MHGWPARSIYGGVTTCVAAAAWRAHAAAARLRDLLRGMSTMAILAICNPPRARRLAAAGGGSQRPCRRAERDGPDAVSVPGAGG